MIPKKKRKKMGKFIIYFKKCLQWFVFKIFCMSKLIIYATINAKTQKREQLQKKTQIKIRTNF